MFNPNRQLPTAVLDRQKTPPCLSSQFSSATDAKVAGVVPDKMNAYIEA